MSHYYAEKMFNPVLVSPAFRRHTINNTSTDEVDVFVVSEMLEEIKDLRLDIYIQRFDSLDRVGMGKNIGKNYTTG